jgi:hypothetical protein
MPGIGSSAAFSPDSSRIVAGAWDGRFRVFRAVDGSPVGVAIQQEGPVSCLTFDATGSIVITGSTDRHIRFWDAALGRRVAPDIEVQASVAGLRTTVSGDLVDVANDGSMALWAGGTWMPMFLQAPVDEPLRGAHFLGWHHGHPIGLELGHMAAERGLLGIQATRGAHQAARIQHGQKALHERPVESVQRGLSHAKVYA